MSRGTLFILGACCLVATVLGSGSSSASLANLFAPEKTGKLPKKRCLNIGSWFVSDGPFEATIGLVKYAGTDPKVLSGSGDVENTSFDHAFLTQRQSKKITFNVRVAKNFKYSVSLGFAEIQKKLCKNGARILNIDVGGVQKNGVDIFKSFGCRRAGYIEFKDVMANNKGLITITIRATKGSAVLAVACFGRGVGVAPSPRPSRRPRPSRTPSRSPTPTPSKSRRPRRSRTPTPTPTRSSTPAPSRSSTPAPSRSSTPAPSRSSTPAPSRSSTPAPSRSSTPAPSRSSTPRPTPSNSPKPGLDTSRCAQAGCMNFEGHGDYVVTGNSMSVLEDRRNCNLFSATSARFSIPAGATIKKVLLYWSATGSPGSDVILNGRRVWASRTYRGGSSGYHFYGAEADVTSILGGSRTATVSGIRVDRSSFFCQGNALYAAWSLVVVYSSPLVPRARINVCSDWFTFTFPAGDYSSIVGCVDNSHTSFAKTTVVTFEGDAYKGEHFFINGGYRGNNLFRGVTRPNLDIRNFDITHVVRSGARSIKYTIRSYRVYTAFGPAIEGLFMPIRIVYYRY